MTEKEQILSRIKEITLKLQENAYKLEQLDAQ